MHLYETLQYACTRLSVTSTEAPQFEISNTWSNGSATLTLRGNRWRTREAAATSCWVNTTLRMGYESTSG